MTIDRDGALRLASMEPEAAVEQLIADGSYGPDGLDTLLDLARSIIRDDPAMGERLAEVVRVSATAAGAPVALPKATYLLAQGRAAAGDMEAALSLIDDARTGFDALGRTTDALRTNLGRSQALNEMGRHDEALAACHEILAAVEVDVLLHDPATIGLVAAAHQNSGLCLELSGRFEEALDHYASATVGYESLSDVQAVAEVTYDRALVLLSLGQHTEALATLQRSAQAFRDGGYRALLVMALANTAEVQLHRGEYQQCLASLSEASDALEDISAPGGEQTRLIVAGRAYLALNLLPEAVATFGAALEQLDRSSLVIDRARAKWGQGLAFARLGQTSAAASALADAAQQFRRSGQSTWLAEVLLDEAQLQRTAGDPAVAERSASEAFTVATPDTPAHASARLILAELTGGDVDTAVRSVLALGLAPLDATALHVLGRWQLSSGQVDEAIDTLRRAVAQVEMLRGNLSHEHVLTRFLDDKLSPYGDLLNALVARGGDADDALRVAEQAKSRTLSDVVSGLVTRDRHLAVDDSIDVDLRAAYGELFGGDAAADPVRTERLRRRLHELEARREFERLREIPTAATSGTGSEQAISTAAPPAGAAYLSYAVAGDAVHVFVVTASGTLLVPHIATLGGITGLMERLRRQWDRFRLGPDLVARHLSQMERSTEAVLRELHAALFAPIEPLLLQPAVDRLVVIPDVQLHDVPFHALWSDHGPLLERFVVSYSPSLATLHHLPPRRQGETLVTGLADELAPMVEREVAEVAARVPGAISLAGPAATWAAIEAHLHDVGHLHMAGHAMFRPDNPMYSALKLHDRWLTAADALSLDLEGGTVVLSACDTARTQHAGTAEINGFVRGFLGAGAATVVASQWTADDAATTSFMVAFYEQGLTGSPAAAVRHAQQVVRARWPHPYYWAPWVVVGRGEPAAADG